MKNICELMSFDTMMVKIFNKTGFIYLSSQYTAMTHEAPFYSCVFGKRNYRVLVRVSVCVCVCLCVCVCFCTITQKEIDLGTRNQNTL